MKSRDEVGVGNSQDAPDVELTVTRSWALADGVNTTIQSITATVILDSVAWIKAESFRRGVQFGEDIELELRESEPPKPTIEAVRRTLAADSSGTTLSTASGDEFRVFGEEELQQIVGGEATDRDVILLTDSDCPRGYVCTARPVILTRLVSGVFGEGETFCQEYTEKSQLRQLQDLRQESVELSYEDGYIVHQKPKTTLDRVRHSVWPAPPEPIGMPVDNVPLRRESLREVYEDIFCEDESSVVPEQGWVSVTMQQEEGAITLEATDDARCWLFDTNERVLIDEADIMFFKQLGFHRLEEDRVTLKVVEAHEETDSRARWKRSEDGEWWLAPVTVQ